VEGGKNSDGTPMNGRFAVRDLRLKAKAHTMRTGKRLIPAERR